MSTRASILFRELGHELYLDRSHDGFPENVVADIKEVIQQSEGSWSRPEAGLLASALVVAGWPSGARLPDYTISRGIAGDESYRYFVVWNRTSREWEITARNYNGDPVDFGDE